MFKIDTNKNIYLTRGDIALINVNAKNIDGSDYMFNVGDIVRLNVFKRQDCHSILLKKDVTINEKTSVVNISLTSEETKIGELASKPIDYWYEIVLNPDTYPQTIVGYLDNPTVFRILPEGGESND